MKLPSTSGIKLAKALGKLGFEIDHQTGSHFILRLKEKPFTRLTVPNHKTIAIGTLLAIMRQAGISREELQNLL